MRSGAGMLHHKPDKRGSFNVASGSVDVSSKSSAKAYIISLQSSSLRGLQKCLILVWFINCSPSSCSRGVRVSGEEISRSPLSPSWPASLGSWSFEDLEGTLCGTSRQASRFLGRS